VSADELVLHPLATGDVRRLDLRCNDRDEIDVADSRIEATETAEQPEGGEDQGMKRTPRVDR
jgi:hypothetical protein